MSRVDSDQSHTLDTLDVMEASYRKDSLAITEQRHIRNSREVYSRFWRNYLRCLSTLGSTHAAAMEPPASAPGMPGLATSWPEK